ncbi:MAG TPA: hypothetical protein VD836_04565 [Solirubrobacteraceae bacterium]|nr:hypothetical protein [Solirubrobacteraceae bacterium]
MSRPSRHPGLAAAATQPVNVLVPTAVIVAAAFLGALWLVPVALACWLGLTAMALADERRELRDDAGPAPGELGPAIRRRVRDAMAAGAAVRSATAASPSPLEDVGGEVDLLVAAVRTDAARAQSIHEFLSRESPDALRRRLAGEPRGDVRAALEVQLSALDRLQGQLDDALAGMDQVIATVRTVHAEILAADGLLRRPERDEMAGQVSELRMRVQTRAEGLEEVFGETRRLLTP